jgi:hypothetical protein
MSTSCASFKKKESTGCALEPQTLVSKNELKATKHGSGCVKLPNKLFSIFILVTGC